MKKRLTTGLVLFMVLIMCISAQTTQKGTINGFVYDATNGETLIGANVYFKEIAIGSGTNLSGYYIIPDIPPGVYTLVCEYIGYKMYTKTIIVKAGQNDRININLEADVLTAETIVVKGDSIKTVDKLFNQPISKLELSPVEIKHRARPLFSKE